MIEKIPTIIPSTVNDDLNLLALKEANDILINSENFIIRTSTRQPGPFLLLYMQVQNRIKYP
ncbi:hypothetical protein BMS3Abin04_03137 [bacterium BMS3Abin04]|nr:hypothetical protein BMS3Abin04_03137 [bacterium BMS3Abin04]